MSIVVVGSTNMDVVMETENYPNHGETIFCSNLNYFSGGKGANQATACARLEKETYLISCVGRDSSGNSLIQTLNDNHVNTAHVKQTSKAHTGTAHIIIDHTSENTMVVLKGANQQLTISDIIASKETIISSKILLVQMEIEAAVAIYAMEIAKQHGVKVILDPAPAEGVDIRALSFADIIVPNQQETMWLTGIEVVDIATAVAAAKYFEEQLHVSNSVIKMGAAGSVVYYNGSWEYVGAISVDAVDTVGAGDSFAGALACALYDEASLLEAVQFASIVSAIKVMNSGAQDGIPTIQEVKKFSEQRNLHCFLK